MNELKGSPLKIHSYQLSWNDVPGHVAMSIYFKGCNLGCPGCHNEELHSHEGECRRQSDVFMSVVTPDITDYVCLIGGEPLYQDNEKLRDFIRCIKCHSKKKVCMYTGYLFNEVPRSILEELDMIKVGQYGDYQYYFEKVNNEWVEMEENRIEIQGK